LPAPVIAGTPHDIAGTNIVRDIPDVSRHVTGVVANNIDQGDTGNGLRGRGLAQAPGRPVAALRLLIDRKAAL